MKHENVSKFDNYIEEINNVAHNMAKSQQALSEDCHSAVANLTTKCNRIELQYLTINQNISDTKNLINNRSHFQNTEVFGTPQSQIRQSPSVQIPPNSRQPLISLHSGPGWNYPR